MNIAENFRAVLSDIEDACRSRTIARDEKVTLLAVTKYHSVESMREAIDAGACDIGENRVQEAAEKFSALNRNVTRHLIGHLQTNKVKAAVKLFDVIQSVDSVRLAKALDKAAKNFGKVQDVLIQINLAYETQKFGVLLEDFDALINFIDAAENLRLRGLMTIAPNFADVEQCRPLFRQMRTLYDELRPSRKAFDMLSMGMTYSYKIAVAEGANVVRIGTAIFGERL